jgi:hypothetical protein
MMPAANFGDMRLRYAVHTSQYAIAFIAGANSVNSGIVKPAVPMVKTVVVPALFRSVGIVLGFSSNAQMSRIDTRRVVANVHDDFSFRDWAYKVFIRIPMGAYWLFARKKEDPVSTMVFGPSPQPTVVAFFKSLLKNVCWFEQFKIMQTAVLSQSAIASAAQFSSNRFFVTTNNTRKRNFSFISHIASSNGACIL